MLIALTARGSSESRSARAGVFTAAQAKRGKAEYLMHCAMCHRDDLGGSDRSPALVGTTFMANWADKTLADLVDRIQTTMPQGDPGTLTRKVSVDIATYLLDANDYPTGPQELPEDVDALQHLAMK
jgi:mono/diheme cytochrome c family protein